MSLVQMGMVAAGVTPFALSIWIAFVHRTVAHGLAWAAPEELDTSTVTRACFAAETLDLAPAVQAVAHDLRDPAMARSVRLELAIDPGLKARVDPSALKTVLRDTVRTAIQATPGGQVLISGMMLGGQLHIRITDDGKDTDQRTRESQARDSEALIALHGGSIRVEVRPGRATTVAIRLPLPGDKGGTPNEMPALEEQAA